MARLVVTSGTNPTLINGVVDERFPSPVWHFRGISYAHIAARFAKPEYVALSGEIDGTKFGPQCPQPPIDIGHLLRIPRHVSIAQVEEDEFKCLNLNVTLPPDAHAVEREPMPVLVWIHGGSQCVTFASSATAVCDPTPIVAQSIDLGKPMIMVTFNYRLNIFAFGDGRGEINLALQDQRLALEWVQRNIASFGGDPNRVTLAGESAGAVYVHAHILSQPSMNYVQRAILASGSLYLSPPQPREAGNRLIHTLTQELASKGDALPSGSAESLVQGLVNCGVVSMWLQQEPCLDDWESRLEPVDALMISDVEFESAIWRNGVELMHPEEINSIICECSGNSDEIKKLYHIDPERPTSSMNGVLDFINDTKFALPAFEICERWRNSDKKNIYHSIIDEANPWQASSRAHHAVDLILLFGGIDLSFNPGAEKVGANMRKAWIEFVHGGGPWPESCVKAFGPHGKFEELDQEGYMLRRRVRCFKYLQSVGLPQYRALSNKLCAGRMSLLN